MDDVTEIRAGTLSACHLVGESREDAFCQSLVGCGRRINIEPLPLGKAQELIVDARCLAGGIPVDGKLAAAVGAEVIPLGPAEGAPHHEEVGSTTPEEILPLLLGLPVGAH